MGSSLHVGEKYNWKGEIVLLTAVEAGRALITSEEDGQRAVLPVDPSELEPLREKKRRDFLNALSAIPAGEWDKASKRAERLKQIVAMPAGRSEEVAQAAVDLGVSVRQVWRLLRVYESNPIVSALLAVKCGRPDDLRLLGSVREDIVQRCIEKHYLTSECPTVAELHRAVDAECFRVGVPAPTPRTLRRRIARLVLKDVIKRRDGRKKAGETCEGVPGSVAVSALLERVEIDHTLVDVILRADTPRREVVGRPWLTIAIDCKSRMVVGFHIGFERPTAESIAMCLAMAALPKAVWLKNFGIEGSWPVHGIPKQIWADNALEFRSEALRRGCNQHGTILHFRPVGAPRYGGIIERLIGTVMGRVHVLPGTTQSNVIQRGEYEAEARAVMTLSEFIPWFAEQVVTGYHCTPHRSLGISPLDQWKADLAVSEIRSPRDALEYYSWFLPREERCLTRLGVQLPSGMYWSDEFLPWVGQKKRVQVHFHRLDASKVFVVLPNGRICTAVNSDESTRGKTMEELAQGRRYKKEISDSQQQREQRAEGFFRNQERLEEAARMTAQARRSASPQQVGEGRETSPMKVVTVGPSVSTEADSFAVLEMD